MLPIAIFMSLYLMFLLIITFSPFEFSMQWAVSLFGFNTRHVLEHFFYIGIDDLLVNVLLFIPVGLLLNAFVKRKRYRLSKRWFWLPLIAGMGLSLLIEGTQLFLRRTSAVFDVLANGAGTVLGFWLFRQQPLISKLSDRALSLWRSLWVRILAVACVLFVILILTVLPYRLNHLGRWDETYALLVGNEATGDRPWKGEVYGLTIYDKALSLDEVRNRFRAGREMRAEETEHVVVSYAFDAGRGEIIRDRSDVEDRLDVTDDSVQWLEGGGVGIDDQHWLQSTQSGMKIVEAVRETSAFSVEVWFRTRDTAQGGPARIVTLSHDTNFRNFTLGQQGTSLQFRVRTPLTGWNGSWICLEAESNLDTLSVHYAVATFNRGLERLYVDGRAARELVRADTRYWPLFLELGRTPFSRWAFCYMVFVPLGCFFYAVFRENRIVFAFLSGVALSTFMTGFYSFFLGQPFGWFFVLLSSAFMGVGILSAFLWSRHRNAA